MLNQTEFPMQGAKKTKASREIALINLNEMWRILGVVVDEPAPNSEKGRAAALAFMNNAKRISKQQ